MFPKELKGNLICDTRNSKLVEKNESGDVFYLKKKKISAATLYN